MQRKSFLRLLVAATVLTGSLGIAPPTAYADEGIAVIANAPLKGVDADLLKRIYSGRTIELDRMSVRPVNQLPVSTLRRRFTALVLQQSDEDYIAYWTVRRYVGQGTPPRELASSAEVIDYVATTPGAIGYIDAADVKPGMNVIFRR